MPSRQLKLPVPTHVIFGKLGSGKTSLIRRLLSLKPEKEVWAVLINEIGTVSIDQDTALTGDDSIAIKEAGGRCICCSSPTVTSAALVQLIRKEKPDRLIIETSGSMTDPSSLLNLLKSEHLRSALDIQPVLWLIDCSSSSHTASFLTSHNDNDETDAYTGGSSTENGIDDKSKHIELVLTSDILIGSKADMWDVGDDDARYRRESFMQWANDLIHAASVQIGTPSSQSLRKKSILLRNTSDVSLEDVGIGARSGDGSGGHRGSRVSRDDDAMKPSLPTLPSKKEKSIWLTNRIIP